MTDETVMCLSLIEACKAGNIAQVSRLILNGVDVSFQDEETGSSPLMVAAVGNHSEIIELLLENGAPWNALDRKGFCAGDYAMQNGNQEAMDALLNAALRSELILGASNRSLSKSTSAEDPSNNLEYLSQRVEYSETALIDGGKGGVMMEWERPLMEAHAQVVCHQGGEVLNVGFGMGIIDSAIQKRGVSSHTIIEAHPAVLKRMEDEGWSKKPNVRIIPGKWQDVIQDLGKFDGVFFDTYGEYYDDLREFHEKLPLLLKPNGIYSFFNGMCADNAFFHTVYCQMAALELQNLGFSTEFIPLPVKDALKSETWQGIDHKYWQLDTYFLPVCTFMDESNEDSQNTE